LLSLELKKFLQIPHKIQPQTDRALGGFVPRLPINNNFWISHGEIMQEMGFTRAEQTPKPRANHNISNHKLKT
jgi:hypothetical protein